MTGILCGRICSARHRVHACTPALAAATEAGAIVMPPVPAFYAKPKTLDDIINHTCGRALDLFDIDTDAVRRWGEDVGKGAG